MKVFSVNFLRPLLLLGSLFAVAGVTAHQVIYSRSWHQPLDVVIFPINGDNSPATRDYIKTLDDNSFADIDDWLAKEATRYELPLSRPTLTRIGSQVESAPPELPVNKSILHTVLWGLQLRYWVFRNTPDDESNLRRVRIFVAYHEGEDNKPLAHSVGLQQGLIGVVHAFSQKSQNAQNNIVIAHELLHTVGASDKYDVNGDPEYPIGYANPLRSPLFPQRYAEIMVGRIPISRHNSLMATNFKSVRINALTAQEIAWVK